MKDLRDYEAPGETVMIDAEYGFTVRGIDLEDLLRLAGSRSAELAKLYEKSKDRIEKDGLRPEVIGMILQGAMLEFPELTAEIIAHASDRRDQTAKIRKLPANVQIEAINKIVGLTFTTEGSLKKFLETVAEMFERLTMEMGSLTQHSANGYGAFASR